MHKILYSSRVTAGVDHDEMQDILRVSRRNNQVAGLTGMLLHHPATDLHPATFLQVLEGERTVLETAYERIADDPRHHDVELLSSRPTEARQFGDWTMSLQYVTDEDLRRVLPGFAANDPDAVRIEDLTKSAAVAEMLLHSYVTR